jgi:WXXGXW repeat (2 copies)
MHIRFLRGLLPALALAALPAISSAALFVGVSVNVAPPALPVYVQPPCPEAGYIWTPGYWGWNDGAYYWVPGTWIEPPTVGFLWTPGYWGWEGGAYLWHAGYWGPHVGFYGGVNYGFGYDGAGYAGGYWRGRTFMYNRAVVHVGPTFVTNVYSRPDPYRGGYAHVSFNGGPGGVVAHASRAQMAAAHDHHVAFTSVQQRQQRMAFANRSLRADTNHGRPPVAATARAGVFRGNGVSAARAAGGPMHVASTRSMRSDRPRGASGQNHAARPMGHTPAVHRRAGFGRPQQQHFQQRPQTHQSFRPQARPQARPEAHRQAPHPQQRGGGGGHRPPENRGGGQHNH